MRYIPNTDAQRAEMLSTVGVSSVEDLFADLPSSVKLKGLLDLPEAMSEMDLLKHLKSLAGQNLDACSTSCFLGAGVYDHFIPVVIDHMISRGEFTTSYTPYQPEISQGTLQAIFEYQTMICELTGMDVANASMYDGATSIAEAVYMACASTKKDLVLVARSVNPQSRAVLETYASLRGITVQEIGHSNGTINMDDLKANLTDKVGAVVVQSPNFFGSVEDLKVIGEMTHDCKALFVVASDLMALSLLEAPGKLGADVVVGDGQSAGNAMSFGGPHFGFFASTQKLVRKIPGRIVGETLDRNGKKCYVLTLQAREQHIRREKASSNICSNQSLCALAGAVYLSLMGKEGLKEVAKQCLLKAAYTRDELVKTGSFQAPFTGTFFREFVVTSKEAPEAINSRLMERGVIGGYDLTADYPELENGWLVAVTEKRTKAEIDGFVAIAGGK
nr:aminomethyl-transferring glycine dehydrogenase subunit GcvPA [uncultured Dethiosulfovibrio sp.]